MSIRAAQILSTLHSIFGQNTVFLPIQNGAKRPTLPDWQKLTLEDTRQEPYQRNLLRNVDDGGGIGALLGPASDRLLAVDIDKAQVIEPFVSRHPWLASTTRTSGQRGCQFFANLEEGCPYPNGKAVYKLIDESTGEDFGELRLGGAMGAQSVVYGIHPAGIPYRILIQKPPVVISLADLYELAEEATGFPTQEETKSKSCQVPVNLAGVCLTDDFGQFFGRRIKPYVDACEPAISRNHGHDTTFRVACQLVHGFNLYRNQALEALRYYNQTKCEPPWSEKELEHKVDDALKAPCDKPRGYLLDNNPRQQKTTPALVTQQEVEPPFSKQLKQDYPSGPETATPETKAPQSNGQADVNIDWEQVGQSQAAERKRFLQKAIYPKDSILADFVEYGLKQTEGAEAYIIGTGIATAAALLGRRIYVEWGEGNLYPNVFVMLAGKAGDRKSYTIHLGYAVARECLPLEAFLPTNFSPETLFDAYDLRPDKIWIVDDANIVLVDWRKSSNGERVASRFLGLYDCKPLSESFRRNKKETAEQTSRREIPETSTTLLFGATFNAACFQGQALRAGFDRRFMYYVADGPGRVIIWPKKGDLRNLATYFDRLKLLSGELLLEPAAQTLWEQYQRQNRKLADEIDPSREAELSRLATAPAHVLKIAMIFETCRSAYLQTPLRFIQEKTLKLAIDHVEECLRSAGFLDKLANRAFIAQQAEALLAKIRAWFNPTGNAICLARSQLTARFAAHPGRAGALTPDDLYLRIIPMLVSQGNAVLLRKGGKNELYAFKPDDYNFESASPSSPNSPTPNN